MLPFKTDKLELLPGLCRKWTQRALSFGFALVLAAGSLVAPAYAIDPGVPGNVFELDRNATDEGANTKDDWANVLFKGPNIVNGDIIATTLCSNGHCDQDWPGVLPDPPGISLFVQGSKDTLDITDWSCRDQKAPDKDELTNAYAVAYKVPNNGGNDLIAFFGADRFDNAGTATMGFWLLQASIPQPACLPTGDGRFLDALGSPAVHAVNDLLVVADFTNGGAIGTVRVFKWVGSGGSDGALDKLFDSQGSPNVDCFNAPAGDICGTINQGPTASPWTYIPKGVATDSPFITFGFMEIGVNLSRVFQGTVPCFSTFVAETRSSAEPNASQKDFVMGSFNVCGIDVSKDCTNNQANVDVTPIQFSYDVGGCITNTGFGSVTDFALSDSPDPLTNLKFYRPNSGFEPDATACESYGTLKAIVDAGNATEINSSASIAPDERIIWLASFTSTVNGQHDTVTATARSGSGGPVLTPATDDAFCPSRQFNPGIDVEKDCTVLLQDAGSQLVVKSRITGFVCNTGDVPLDNVTVVDSTAGGPPGSDIPNPILGPISLPRQANYPTVDCTATIGDPPTPNPSVVFYDVTYTPDTLPTGANAARFTFSDQVTATGTPPAGAGTTRTDTDSAECSLCPECAACTQTFIGPASLDKKAKPHKK
ncbi:MAG: hypothetical protein NDI77_05305 [Geobacteraceae bacterium]|nr:hypothetical protein [Geobacteraceae bacterium]